LLHQDTNTFLPIKGYSRNTLRYQNRKRQKILRVTKKYSKEMANKVSMVFIFLGLLAIVCTTRAREVPSEKGLDDQKNFVGFGGGGGGLGGLGGLGGGDGGLGGCGPCSGASLPKP
ncbi:hypothetical protein AABB24_030638, partial [Solanum stoloniferum]